MGKKIKIFLLGFLIVFSTVLILFLLININGKRRLELFFDLAQKDSLLFSSTIDIEKSRKALGILEKEERIFRENQDLLTSLFPFNFLYSFLDASEVYGKLEKQKTPANAQELILMMKNTLSAYRKDLDDFKNKISELSKHFGPEQKIALMGGETYITFNEVLLHIDKMEENAKLIEKEIETRKKCLEESTKFCDAKGEQNLLKNINLENTEKSITFFSKELSAIPLDLEIHGPYELSSKCWGEPFKNYFYIREECPENRDYCMESQYLANKSYMSMSPLSGTFGKALKENKVELIPQRASTPYSCNDYKYKTQLSSLNNILNLEKLIFADLEKNSSKDKVIAKGKALERQIFESDYPSSADMDVLSSHYRYLSEKKNINEKTKREALERYLIWKEGLVNFDLLVNNFTFHLDLMRKSLELSNGLSSKDYIYGVRTNYPFFFLNFSSTVWRLDEEIEYFKIGERPEEPMGIYTYDEAIEKYGEEEISEWLDIYSKLEDRHLMYDRDLEKMK
ncbi:hypothetical protein C0584_02650 [Candidatus Parcubacteria bacterium]|nr:MAG: hypothetical protein C0584_02650 [Candidatus Parcubacteria bacterium]